MEPFGRFYLDKEKDIVVDLFRSGEELRYVLRTPNHNSGNLITNLARLCELPLDYDDTGLKVIRGVIPSYVDGENRSLWIFRMGNTKIANIFPDGSVELKASIPAISKALMSQTKDYRLSVAKTIVKTYIFQDCKFRTDLHTHMSANLAPEVLIALGIHHQIRYPLYYIRKLGLRCTERQNEELRAARIEAEAALADSPLAGKYRERRIDDNTFLNKTVRLSLPIWRRSISTAMYSPKASPRHDGSRRRDCRCRPNLRACSRRWNATAGIRTMRQTRFFRTSCSGSPAGISETASSTWKYRTQGS